MPKRLVPIILFLLILLPSARFAWVNRDMPEFAYLHDDGILFTSAKSLAMGDGYRIASMPETPAQTKQPPLYPLLLSAIWHMNPRFPENLAWATALAWVFLCASLFLVRWYYLANGLGEARSWILVALLGLSPFMILFGTTMFTEVPFLCFVLVALLLAKKDSSWALWATAAAAVCAYLTRTAGIVLFATIPLMWFLEKRTLEQRAKRIVSFLAVVLPFALAWPVWSAMHRAKPMDSTLAYYVDYVSYQFLNVDLSNLGIVLWKNADQVLYGMGALVLPKLVDILPIKILTQVIGFAMIMGVIRMARKGLMRDYALFSIGSVILLLIWHFPSTERLVLPLLPFLLAGLLTEMEHLGNMIKPALRHKDAGQRVVGAGFGLAVASMLLAALGVQTFMAFWYLDSSAAQHRAKLAARRSVYQWIDGNLPREAKVLSYDDPLLYLYSGRKGNYLPLLPRWWYAEDHASIQAAYKDLSNYCRSRGLDYVYFTDEDLSRETGSEDRDAISKLVHSNPELVPVYHQQAGTIFKVSRRYEVVDRSR
jgi:4-amino-4-deoxy-L-arabinose transferase-like glycosyltransferase